MQPRIESISEKKLVGIALRMSIANNRTGELWGKFMPYRKKIKNNLNPNLVSLQIYEKGFNFNENAEFEKWALVEVTDFESIPKNMKPFTLPNGLYAVFNYKGNSTDVTIFQYIFTNWLPNSKYQLDNRPHFEVLGERYKNNDPNSEEEIWIPIKN